MTQDSLEPLSPNRYQVVTTEKAVGATYTPVVLADFVAWQIVNLGQRCFSQTRLRVLDPAVGDGELIVSLLRAIDRRTTVEVHGFDTDSEALAAARERIRHFFPDVPLKLHHRNFLDYVSEEHEVDSAPTLFHKATTTDGFDLIIANPPYVRTQVMGTGRSQALADQFGLTGRVDLYHAFILAIASVLKPTGSAGLIVSNRFMSTKSGAVVRAGLREKFNIRHVWDLGDTRLFGAAVLPAVLLLDGSGAEPHQAAFTSIYETNGPATDLASNAIAALGLHGVVQLSDGRRFHVQHGQLDQQGGPESVWRLATARGDQWLATVAANSWGTFRDVGKIRVGVKTCADKIFIRTDWHELPSEEHPELLRQLTTHHIARRYRPADRLDNRQILYTHEVREGRRRVVDLKNYPRAQAYLERFRSELEARKYVLEANRMWFEVWVPHDPSAWDLPKLVFRDISVRPTFWIDKESTVVNGDCYWIVAERSDNDDLLWLAAAVGNSTFAEAFYDRRFNNKLYAGRRRFMTQYVEQFPLPDPHSQKARDIIELAKALYASAGTPAYEAQELELNELVWKAFGLPVEETDR